MSPKARKIINYAGWFLLAVFVIMQFFRIDKSVPEYDKSDDFITVFNPGEEVTAILKTSCYDCHSFETVYPWYSNVAPISWWLKDHIDHGRDELNFSEWETYSPRRKDHKLEEAVEEVEAHNMPLKSYLITHRDAKLDDAKMETLVNYINELRTKMSQPEEASTDSTSSDN